MGLTTLDVIRGMSKAIHQALAPIQEALVAGRDHMPACRGAWRVINSDANKTGASFFVGVTEWMDGSQHAAALTSPRLGLAHLVVGGEPKVASAFRWVTSFPSEVEPPVFSEACLLLSDETERPFVYAGAFLVAGPARVHGGVKLSLTDSVRVRSREDLGLRDGKLEIDPEDVTLPLAAWERGFAYVAVRDWTRLDSGPLPRDFLVSLH